jgi:hypothetical protein
MGSGGLSRNDGGLGIVQDRVRERAACMRARRKVLDGSGVHVLVQIKIPCSFVLYDYRPDIMARVTTPLVQLRSLLLFCTFISTYVRGLILTTVAAEVHRSFHQ